MGGSMSRTALGWRSHSGWAVLVVVREPTSSPGVLVRRRIELVDASLPRQPYHSIVENGLSIDAASALIDSVRDKSIAAAVAATESVLDEFAVTAVGVAGRMRNVPDDLGRILASHALLHAAEGHLYESALITAATQAGLPVFVLEPDRIAVGAPSRGRGQDPRSTVAERSQARGRRGTGCPEFLDVALCASTEAASQRRDGE